MAGPNLAVELNKHKNVIDLNGQKALLSQLFSCLKAAKNGNAEALKIFVNKHSQQTLEGLIIMLSPEEQIALKDSLAQLKNVPPKLQKALEMTVKGAAADKQPAAKATKAAAYVMPGVKPLSTSVVLTKNAAIKKSIDKAIQKSSLLKLFPESMFNSGTVQYFPADGQGVTLIEQGGKTKNVHIILEGKVKIEIFDSEGKLEKTVIRDSGVVGDRSVMEDTATNAKVTALPGAKVLSIPADNFKSHVNDIPGGAKLDKLLADKFKFLPKLSNKIAGQKGVKLELCRPGEVPITKGATSKYMYLVLDGELGLMENFGEIVDADGKSVKIKSGQPVGESVLLHDGARSATVLNNGSSDVLLLKIPQEAFEVLYKEADFKAYIDGYDAQRTGQAAKSADLSLLKEIGFEHEFNAKVDPKIQTEILKSAQLVYKQLLEIDPKTKPAEAKLLLKFVCESLEAQHLDNPLKYVSHGADHSINTMLQTKQLIDSSPEIRAALKKQFGSVKNGKMLAYMVALFHDIGYPKVTEEQKKNPDLPKWKHQEYSAEMVKNGLKFETLSKIMPGLTKAHYDLFITAIEHHGSDSLKLEDFDAKRPFRFAALSDNPLLVLMRLSDNLDMLKVRLNAVQTDPFFLKVLGVMADKADKIKKKNPALSEAELKAKIKESNKAVLEKAEKIIDEKLAKEGEKGKFKYELMKEILRGCNHVSHLHFGSVELAQNISVTIENGKVKVSLAYNTPLQYVPLTLADFQVDRLKISLASMMLDGKTGLVVEGLGKVKIKNGELYINGKKVADPDFKTIETISKALNDGVEKMDVKHFAPPPSAKKFAAAMAKLPQNTGMYKLELVQNLKTDGYGAFGPDAMAKVTQDLLAKGKKATWVSVNVSKLKYFNDTFGHKAGDAYLQALTDKLIEATKGTAYEIAGKPMVVRQGPNFFILLEEGADVKLAQKQFDQVVKGQKFEFVFENAEGVKEVWEMDLAPHVNQNVMVFDPATGEYAKVDIHNAANQNIHYLNQKQLVGEQITVNAKEMAKFRLTDRIVEYSKYVGLKPLAYIEAFEKAMTDHIIEMQQGKAGKGAVAYFDGNKTGGYRAWGFAGEIMIDALFQKRLPLIVQEVFTSKGYDVTVVRYGPGSEEFFIFGKDMDGETMKKCMLEFMDKLSEPFKVRMEVSELKKTKLGQAYLSGELTGKKPGKYLHTYDNGSKAWVVNVDINDPRGPKGEYKGAAITAAVKEIELYDKGKIQAEAELSGKKPADIIYKMNKDAVEELGESAKKANGLRGNVLVTSKGNGKYTIHLPGKGEVTPEYLDAEYRQELLKLTEGQPLMESVIKALTPEELVQIKAEDVKKGDYKKVAGPKLYKVNVKGLETTADLVKAIGEAPQDSIVVYESTEKVAIRGKASHFEAWLSSADPKKADKAFLKIVKATAKANPGLPKAFIAGFLAARKAQLAQEFKNGGKYVKLSIPLQEVIAPKVELVDRLTTFKFETEGPDGKKLSVKVNIKDAQDLLSSEADVSKQAKARIIKQVKQQVPGAKTVEIVEALKTHLSVLQTTQLASNYMNGRLSKVYAEVYLKGLADVSGKLNASSAKKAAGILANLEKGAMEAVEAYKVGFEAKANEYIIETGKKNLTEADFEKIWEKVEAEKLIVEGKYAKYHTVTMSSMGKVVARAGKDGLMGLGVGAVLEGAAELLSDNPSFSNYLKKVGQSGLHWARFGLMCGASEYLLGWSSVKSMGVAMALPALWDLGNVPYAAKGQVLMAHAAGIGGFVLGMKAASVTKVVKIPKVGGVAGLAIAMGGAWVFGKVNSYAYGKSETWRDIVDSTAFKTTGAVLGESGDFITAAWGVSIGAKILAGAASGLASLDALGVALGGKATLGGASGGLSASAGVLSTTAGVLLTLAAVKGGFAAHYHLANGEYEKSIAERLGKELMEYYKYKDSDSTITMAGWAITELFGGSFKYDQFVEQGAEHFGNLPGKTVEYKGSYYTEYQKKYLEGVIEYIGQDFEDSLTLGKNLAIDYSQSAFQHVLNEKGLTGNTEADYNMALAHVKSQVADLSEEIILNEEEQEIYDKVMSYVKSHKVSGFQDPYLVSFVAKQPELIGLHKKGSKAYVAGLSEAGPKQTARAVLKKIELAMAQNQIKYLLLVDPKNMGDELNEMISSHIKLVNSNEEMKAKHKEQVAKFAKKHPEIAQKIINGEKLTSAESYIYMNSAGMMGKTFTFNSPFEGTAIMKMGKVQKLHDQVAKFFDEKGRLKPGKAEAFAKWVLSQKIKGKDFKGKLKEMENYKELRAQQLLVTALQKNGNINVTYQDKKLGLVDAGNNLNMDNAYVKKALVTLKEKVAKSAAKQKEAAKGSYKKANAQAKEWQKKYIYWKKKQLEYMTQDEGDPAKLKKANKNLAYTEKKLKAAMTDLVKAQGELQSFDLQVKVLQRSWHKEKDPVKKAMLAAQIEGLGGSTKDVNGDYFAKLDKLVSKLESTDPKSKPKTFAAVVNKLLALKA